MVCEKHSNIPASGYSPCAGCEVERLNAEISSLKHELQTAITEMDSRSGNHAKIARENTNSRAENKILREALTTIKLGEHDPAMDEDPIENDSDRYREWVRRDQDCAEDALNKVSTNSIYCVWTNKEYRFSAACSGLTGWKIRDESVKFCPFCGKEIKYS